MIARLQCRSPPPPAPPCQSTCDREPKLLGKPSCAARSMRQKWHSHSGPPDDGEMCCRSYVEAFHILESQGHMLLRTESCSSRLRSSSATSLWGTWPSSTHLHFHLHFPNLPLRLAEDDGAIGELFEPSEIFLGEDNVPLADDVVVGCMAILNPPPLPPPLSEPSTFPPLSPLSRPHYTASTPINQPLNNPHPPPASSPALSLQNNEWFEEILADFEAAVPGDLVELPSSSTDARVVVLENDAAQQDAEESLRKKRQYAAE
eukprot:s6485_g3.t1